VLAIWACSREIASSPLSSRWSDEHVTVESIETAHGRVEAKATLAVLADDDAGNLVVDPIDRVSFGHEFPCAGDAGVLLL
jgi:hypothetical protein